MNTPKQAHIDTSEDPDSDFLVTALYYCNPHWKREDGGRLRVKLFGGESRDVAPLADRVVVLFSKSERETERDRERKMLPCMLCWFLAGPLYAFFKCIC